MYSYILSTHSTPNPGGWRLTRSSAAERRWARSSSDAGPSVRTATALSACRHIPNM